MPHQPPDPNPALTPVRDELAAMRRIAATLDSLDAHAQARVVGWMWDRYVRPTIDDEEPDDDPA